MAAQLQISHCSMTGPEQEAKKAPKNVSFSQCLLFRVESVRLPKYPSRILPFYWQELVTLFTSRQITGEIGRVF